MKLRAAFLFALIVSFTLSLSGLAESYERDRHNSHFVCKHTHQKVERTKLCPCGCNKKKRTMAFISSDATACDDDLVIAHVPGFSKIVGSGDTIGVISPVYMIQYSYISLSDAPGIRPEPLTAPG